MRIFGRISTLILLAGVSTTILWLISTTYSSWNISWKEIRYSNINLMSDRLIQLEKNLTVFKHLATASLNVLDTVLYMLKERGNLLNLSYVSPIIPVLVLACNRISINKPLDQLIQYRPNEKKFPIIVSQDGSHGPTYDVIKTYVDRDKISLIQQLDQSPVGMNAKPHMRGYYRIARHYKWALDQVFLKMNYSVVIILEDDLSISPDFFEYFQATYPILSEDKTLWCVSAWNDNGIEGHIEDLPEVIYRTDFFPGLGWMVMRSVWLDIREQWPQGFWDDHLRSAKIRRHRQCLRPEISRTSTFGRSGVSSGQFFDVYLRHIKLNQKKVHFTKMDLSHLLPHFFDLFWSRQVYDDAIPFSNFKDFLLKFPTLLNNKQTARVEYSNRKDYVSIAKALSIMPDLKDGVGRTAYQGVVSIVYKGVRVYLAPELPWLGYDSLL